MNQFLKRDQGALRLGWEHIVPIKVLSAQIRLKKAVFL